MVGYFENKDHPLAAAFLQLADNTRDDFRFAHTFSADTGVALGAEKNTVVVIQPKRLANKFEESKAVYSGKPNWKSIKDFVAEKM